MLTPYRRVLSVPGALAFSSTALLARLPISMVSLGIVLLVSARTGSYRTAGTVAAAYIVGNAAFAVAQGRLTDRLGQSKVLPRTVLVFAVAMALTMVSVEAGWHPVLIHLFAALSGAAMPQVGSSVRARWSYTVRDKRLLQTAFALEAVVDEVVFVIGPVVVTLLATAVHPLAGLVTAVVAGVTGTLLLSVQRATEPPVRPHAGRRWPREPMGWAVLGPLTLAGLTLGVVFGGVEVATVAFTEELGVKTLAGPLLAFMAFGSLVAGVVTGSVSWRSSNATRFRWGMVALALATFPLPLVDGFAAMAFFLLVAGLAVSPTLIASVAWVEETVPEGRLTEGIAVITTGLAVGLAPGAALVGAVIDRYGASASYWVTFVAAVLGALLAVGTLLSSSSRPAS